MAPESLSATAVPLVAGGGKFNVWNAHFPVVAPAWANAVLAVAAMKHTDISRQKAFLWLLIKSIVLLACSSGNKCSGGTLQNEMSCWMDEVPSVLLN
jgi:hypothetical protein